MANARRALAIGEEVAQRLGHRHMSCQVRHIARNESRAVLWSTFPRTAPAQVSASSASSPANRRLFTVGISHQKKGGKANRAQAQAEATAQGSTPNSKGQVLADEAFDFSGLESSILKSLEKLAHDLSQLRAGGRFNPETLEALRVQLDKTSKETVRLSDLAQVVPRGRNISVVVGDKEVCLFHKHAHPCALTIKDILFISGCVEIRRPFTNLLAISKFSVIQLYFRCVPLSIGNCNPVHSPQYQTQGELTYL